MDGPERGIGSGGECCGLFCFVFTFTFMLCPYLQFEGSQGGGLGSEGVSLPSRLPLPFAFALSFAFAFAFWRGSNWVGEVGVIVN